MIVERTENPQWLSNAYLVADETGAIHAEADRQFVQHDFLPDLIERALEERRVDRRDGLHAVRGRSSSVSIAISMMMFVVIIIER